MTFKNRTFRKTNISFLISIILGSSLLVAIPSTVQIAQAASCSNMDRSSGWNARENAKPGNTSWDALTKSKYTGNVEGWFDKVSATCGDTVGLHLSGNGRNVTVNIYRMGYYNGALARLIYTQVVNSVPKGAPTITTPEPVNMVYTKWPVSKFITINANFPTGIYMARFDDGSKTGYAPLIVKDNLANSPLLLVASTMSWQAYNTWGGYSLYHGLNATIYDPGRIVSFNRPYDRNGESNYIHYEAGLVHAAESASLDIAYTTDNDLDLGKTTLTKTNAIMFGGHSEYWSVGMQNAVVSARDFGINVLFFGANQAYWRSRLENNGRNLASWKIDPIDPYKDNPAMITNNWGEAPNPSNQSTLLGALFAGFGVVANYKVDDGNTWPLIGTGLSTGSSIESLVGNEVDTTDIGATPGVQTFLSSKAILKGVSYNVHLTYYNTPSQAGVIDVSTNGWVCVIDNVCTWTKVPTATSFITKRITQNIMKEASKGPLGVSHPAVVNIPARDTLIPICDNECPRTLPPTENPTENPTPVPTPIPTN